MVNTFGSENLADPGLSLDDLASDWLKRRVASLAAMPGLNNDLGSIQVEADIVAIKHPVFPPYSAGNEVTGITILNGKNLAQYGQDIEVRWKAYEIERRCSMEGWHMLSSTCLSPSLPAAVIRLEVTNGASDPRPLSLRLILSGRARNTGTSGYSWAVPVIPTDVFTFRQSEGLSQAIELHRDQDAVVFTNDTENAHSVQTVLPAPSVWRDGRSPEWNVMVLPGKSFAVCLILAWSENYEAALRAALDLRTAPENAVQTAKGHWERVWRSAFTPENGLFSGSLPVLRGPDEAMLKLYYMGILTLLTCRRSYADAKLKPCYLTLWPRRGEGSIYLAWDLPYTSGILARLDPSALRDSLLTIMTAPMLDYQTTNILSGEHGGWICCAHPQAIHIGVYNLVRWSGDRSWLDTPVHVLYKIAPEQEPTSQTATALSERLQETTARKVYADAVLQHRTSRLPGTNTVSYGNREGYLETIATYAFGTAGHTAVQLGALRKAMEFLGPDVAADMPGLLDAVQDLYRWGDGFFDCENESGTRTPAANLYDIGLVLESVGDLLHPDAVEEIVRFVRNELLTPTWAHCLRPTDYDVVSGVRCDHQWVGSFPAWLPQFVKGLVVSKRNESWIVEWLEGVARITRQGAIGQAYWAEDVYPPESGAAAKCYDELTQGNHWAIASGVYFSEMVLDSICGIDADLNCKLTVRPGLNAWQEHATITNIKAGNELYNFSNGRLQQEN